MSDTFATRNAGQPLEERLEIQALSVDLREAVMACLCGGESRRWTVAELLERNEGPNGSWRPNQSS